MSSTMIVQYQVHDGDTAENQRLIEQVFEDLNTTKPEGLRYASFLLADGVTYVHIAITEGDTNPLLESTAFQAFQKTAPDRQVNPPTRNQSTIVGSYGFFDK